MNPTIKFVRIIARLFLAVVQLLWFFPGVLVAFAVGIPYALFVHAATADRRRVEQLLELEFWVGWPTTLMNKIPIDE